MQKLEMRKADNFQASLALAFSSKPETQLKVDYI